jgi:outer membrane protein W
MGNKLITISKDRTMKKVLVTLFVLLFSGAAVFAQNFYFRAGLGYAFAQAGQSMDASGTPYNGSLSGATQTYDIKGASFSSGLQGQFGFGYMFNSNVGVQLDMNIGLAPKKYTFTADNVNLGGINGSVTIENKASTPVFLLPALVLQTGGDKLNIYSRFGLALPLNTKITHDEIQANAPGTGTLIVDDFTFTIKNSFSLGFAGAAGVKYNLNDRVSLWGEVSMMSMSVYIKQAQLTAVTENGVSYPTSQVPGNQVINYSKSITADSTGANQPAYSQPFSNVGIHFGVSINMGGNSGGHSSHRQNDEDNSKPFRRR